MAVELLTTLDEENGGTGAPSVVTPGLRWLFKGFVGTSGGALGSGQFKVNGGALTTYNIGSVIGSDDNPTIDISLSPIGTYLFEYNIEECEFGSTLTVSNVGCPACNSGSAPILTVCNAGSCNVNIIDHMTGAPNNGGTWAHVSGPQTLTFTNGDDGTVNFSGKAVGTYVARYTVQTCYTDVTIIVSAPPNAGNNNVVTQRCDAANVIVNFEALVGGTPGTWAVTTALPQFGVVNLVNKTYTPADGDGGNTYATPIRYTFVKTVVTPNVLTECVSGCNSSVTLHVDVYPRFYAGQNSANNIICNDGSQRNLRDLLNGEDNGGRWDFFLFSSPNPPPFGTSNFNADLIINGVNAPGYVGTGTNYLFEGADNGTIGFMPGSPAGTYAFRYKRPNQNEICSNISLVIFEVQACVPSCTGNNPTINQNISGNCVNATRGGSVSSLNTETWSYRLSSGGSWLSYTAGTNICGQPYVEFRFVLTFSNGCPNIEKTTVYNVPNPTCSNSPTVSGSFASCAFTLTPGGSITSPVASSVLQWRIQGSSTWSTYFGPISVTGPMTIEYRRIVSYSDGCTQTTTSTQTISGQCATSCNVSISVNSNNNVLTANTSGCGSAGQSIDWRYSSNGSSYGSSIGSGFSLTPTSDGYYKAILTCGTCTDEDIYHFVGTPTEPPGCAGSLSMTFSNNTIHANRVGCIGTVSYDWRYSPTGTGWIVATMNMNSPDLIPSNGPGFYRVFTLCNGQCLFTGDYQVMGTTCNNNPTVSCGYNTGTCQFTLTPGGTVTCEIAQDTMWWRAAGSLDIHQYSGPFTHVGSIEFQRTINCFGDCPDVSTPWTSCNGGTCCNGNSIDVIGSFNQGACQFTLTSVTNVTSTIISDVIHWRQQGSSSWNNYTGPFSTSGVIEYERIVTFQGSCGNLTTGIKTISGSCCTGNNPTVAGSYNQNTCQYTITSGGTNTSTIQSDILEWRQTGSSGSYTTYNGAFTGPSSIEIRRRVTYTDGCTATVPASASGNCCVGNNPSASCAFNNVTCLFTLSPTGSLNSPVSSDIIRWRGQGSSVWNTYSAPFANIGVVEYQREVIFSNGCTTIITAILTCSGTCCSNNAPDTTCSFNGSDCKYTLTKIGTLVSPINTDVVEYRAVGSGTWLTYSVPVVVSGPIEYRRVVSFTNGCTTITTSTKTCSGTCCLNNSPTVSCSFNSSNCQFTLTPGGSLASPVATSTIYWRPSGTTIWQTYSGAISNQTNIEFYREVVFSNSCSNATTSVQSCSGICCANNAPDVTHSFNGTDCKYTLTRTGTNLSPINTDVVEYRDQGSSTWLTYTVPFTGAAIIEYRRTVTYTGGCSQVQTGIKTGTGTCCLGNSPTVSCAYNNNLCQYTLTPGGSVASPVTSSTIYWRAVGNTVWQVYSAPFVQLSNIEYYRSVVFSNGCSTANTAVQTCSGTCCDGNDPDVTCSFNGTDCKYTLTKVGPIVSTINTDVVEYRAVGSGTWLTYTVPVVVSGNIEYRRTVTFTGGCNSVSTGTKTCSGSCCLNNNPTVGCSYNGATCTFTLTPGGSIASPIASSTIYWRSVGATVWQTYTAPFVNQTNIEYYRSVVFSNGCSTANTAVQTCNGTCCLNNNPDVIGQFNGTTCKYELTRTGTATNIATDVVEYRFNNSGTWLTYTVPVAQNGSITFVYRRTVTFSNGCTTIQTDEKYLNGNCCSGYTIGVNVSFNPITCQYTLTNAQTIPGAIEDFILWSPLGQIPNTSYSGPFTYAGPITYRREVLTEDYQCTLVIQSDYNGVCCPTNTPEVTCSKNSATCVYTLTPTGSNISPVATDIIEWRVAGGSTFTTYSAPFFFVGNIEYRRRVTYSNGCSSVTTSTHSCSGTCCTTNTPDVTCSFNAANCQLTLTNTGTNTSTPATDVIQYRAIGSGTWLTYSSPVVVTEGIEYRRVVTYSDGCATITTATHTCGGTCCINNNPEVTCSKNSATCVYTLTQTGTNVSPVSTDVVEWRATGGSTFTAYSGPFAFAGSIEYRRRVTYSNGCASITTATHNCSGLCCTTNTPDVQCSFNAANCQLTLSNTGTNTSTPATDVIQYRAVGSSTWLTYSGPVVVTEGIEYRRVVTYSDGCATITTAVHNCSGTCCINNTPEVTCSKNSATCVYTLTPTGTNVSPVATDIVEWRASGGSTFTQYTGPFYFPGSIEYRRRVTYSNGCASITTSTHNCSGTCCTTNAPDAQCSYNSIDCKFTLTPTGTNTSPIATSVIQYRAIGSGTWLTYSVPVVVSAGIEYRRTVTYSDGCASVTSAVKTCNGLCCLGNNPDVSCNYNGSTCQYTLTPGGTFTSPIATSVIQWRQLGLIGWQTYSGPISQTVEIEFRRTVTFSDGCASITTPIDSCSGTCCTTNQPDATCSFNPVNCQFTLTNSGTVTSSIATDKIEYRTLGSGGAFTQYTVPFVNSSGIEYRRVITFSDGCSGITTTIKTCNGTCCLNNSPDVTGSYNTSTCQFTLTGTGTNTSPVATDVIEWRPAGTTNWTVYNGAFNYVGAIEFRRTVTYSNGCASVTTSIKQLTGICCTTNAPTISCGFNNTTCQYTLTRGGTNTSPITSDIVYWRPIAGGAYNVYSGSFTHNGQIEYYRQVIYSDGCATKTTTAAPCNGACCGNNTPGIQCSFNPADCKYTLTPTGTNVSTVVTDVMQWRDAGLGGSWTTYTVPFTGPGLIEAQRLVTYSDSCVANAAATCGGNCCLNNSPDATCAYNNVTCLYTLTPTGTNTSPISVDIIRWRPVGTTPWNTYTGPFANAGQIEYQRVVSYSNGCSTVTATLHTCNGTCCNGNNPDVTCAFNPTDCKYTLNRIGVNVGTVATDVVQYRLSGSGGSWTTYTVPFTFTGVLEYQRIVTYSNGCTTVTSAIHTCSGDCCTTLDVTTSINGSNNLVANVTGCVGTATVNWYYGTTQANTTTFLGSATTISPSFGSGWYEARVNCSNGCIDSSKIQFTCASSASLNTSLSTLTVTGLSNCPSPSYSWQYSPNGSSGWITANGATNSGSLTLANGNGWYRVQIYCNGICPITLTYQRDCNCSNTAVSVSAVKTTDFVVTATPTGCSGTTYNWTALNGGSISSGQGTNAITTNGKGSYFVQVNCTNGCGAGCSATSNTVNLCNCTLTGGSLVQAAGCNSMQVVGLSGCSGSLSYAWSVSQGATILSGQGTTSIGVDLSGNRQATVSVVVTCSDCGSSLCQKTISNQECIYYGIQADPTMQCSGGGGTQCRIGLELGIARLNAGCTNVSSNLNDYWMVYEGITYYATSIDLQTPGIQHFVYWDAPYTGSCSGSSSLQLYYKGCLIKTFTSIQNGCINSCAPCSPALCQNINEAISGTQGVINQSFTSNGSGNVTFYFSPLSRPDRMILRKNGSVYYDSGCVTSLANGFDIGPFGCDSIIFYQPTSGTPVSGNAPENPFGVIAWKVIMPVIVNDLIGIEIIGGCTGCPSVDDGTAWNFQVFCSF